MSKKLLIAVLTLGFLLTLSGAAFSTGGPDQEWEVKPMVDPATFVDNPDLSPMSLNAEAIEKTVAPLIPGAQVSLPAGTLWPPPYDCELIDYTGGFYDAAFPVPYPAYGGNIFQNLFVSTASGNIGGIVACTVKTATIGLYPDLFVGDPNMVVTVSDGDRTDRGSVTIPFASLPTSAGFITVDLTTIDGGNPVVYTDGARYRVSVSVDEPETDTLYLLIEDTPSWPDGSMLSFWSEEYLGWYWFGPAGPQLNINSEVCCADLGFSECREFYTNCPVEYIYLWDVPHASGNREKYNQLFFVEGPDTLSEFGIALYGYYASGTPDLDVFVWGDVGGLPDESNLIYTTTRDYLDLVWYGVDGSFNAFDVYSEGIVVREDIHIGWTTNLTDDPAGVLDGISDDGFCGYKGASMYIDSLSSFMTLYDRFGGFDVNFKIYAYMCKDEFSVCQELSDYCADYYIYSLPNSGANGRIGCYQLMEPFGVGCRLENVKIMTYGWWDVPGTYLFPSDIEIRYADGSGVDGAGDPVTGVPGTFIASKTINVGEYMDYPAWNQWDVSALDIKFDQPIWIGIKTSAPWDQGVADYFVNADDASCPTGKSLGYYNDGVDEWWTAFDVNFWIAGDVCCIPPPERDCSAGQPDPEWPTSAHDFRRSGASYNSTGDAQCKQAVAWWNNDPVGMVYTRPTIYDGIVLLSYNDKLVAYELAGDGTTPLWTISGLPYIGSNYRNSVTVKDGYVYFGGGNGRSFTKANVYTGSADVPWSRNVLTTPLVGNTTYTSSVILDCDGTEVIFLTTALGEVYALETATGNNYSGWTVNPVMVDGAPLHGLSSNGADVIYVTTDGSFGTGNATLYALDACTGVANWTLGEGTLSGAELSGLENPAEFFRAGASVDLDGMLYFQTAFDNTAGAPSGGYYKVDPNGNIQWAKGGKYVGFCYPVIDGNRVIFSGLRGWTSENNSTVGLFKTTGAQSWESDLFFNAGAWIEGALSCETLESDLYYQGNRDWQFLAVNADDGTVEFEYNYANTGSERGMGIAIDPTYLVMTNRQGDTYVFTEQVDRPRLRIMKFDEFVSVPFFSPNPYSVVFDDVFMNNGCANLTGTLTADEAAPAAYAWTVNPDRISRMQDVANGMVDYSYADMASDLVKSIPVDQSGLDVEFVQSPYSKDSYSDMAAYAPPAWLNGIAVSSFDLGAGESFSVEYSVNGPLVTRGPQRCYLTISTNDQYFLNAPDDPVIQLGVLGGCLESFDLMHFGVGSANEAPVTATGEIGNQTTTALFYIDGNDARYWQGGLFFAVDEHRMAWNTESWHGADPDDFWNSLLTDPNCFDQCEPYVTPDPILLGAISHDGGVTYDDILGYATAAAYIDSVIDFDCYGGGWDWGNNACPYDNDLSMGLRIEEYMYGAIDEAALANVVIYKYDITNRNADPLPGVYVGAFNDFDLDGTLNGFDAFKFSADYSISYGSPCSPAYDFTNGVVYGMGKVPMDVDPMIGTRTCDAQQTMWEDAYVGLDSLWYWMANEPGQTAQAGIDVSFPCDALSESDDRDAFHAFVGHDFGGYETYSFASYFFGFEAADVTDDQFFYDLAVIVNQFCGFGRGDIDADGDVNLADVVALWNMLNGTGTGPLFEHLADVNADGNVDNADVLYLSNYYFCSGPAPVGDWTLPDICPAP